MKKCIYTLTALACTVLAAGAQQAPSAQADPALPNYKPHPVAAGTIRILEESYMQPLVQAWAKAFQALHPEVQFTDAISTSLKITPAVTAGTVDFGMEAVDARLLPTEAAPFATKYGYPISGVHASGGTYNDPQKPKPTAIIVNAANPIQQISLDQLDAVFSTTRKRGYGKNIATWGDLGLKGEWATRPITLYGIKSPNGKPLIMGNTAFFADRVMRGGDFKDGVIRFDNEGKLRSFDLEADAVAKDPGAIGAVTFGSHPNVKVLSLSEKTGGKAYLGSEREVASQQYPLSRDFYLFFNRKLGGPLSPQLREFLYFVLSKQGQQIVVQDGSFLPLPADVVKQDLAAIRR